MDIRHEEKKKAWDHQTVMERIRDSFGEHIPEDVSLQFLMACGNKLVSPKLQEGQELNGMLIHKVYKTKALYTDSEEENELSHITTRSTLSMRTTAKDSDDDCVEVDGPQIHTGMSSHGTTRAATRFRVMRSNDYPCASSHDGDGNPGTSGHDGGCLARSDGNPGTSGHDEGCLARSDGNPGTSGHDEDYSSYLTLVATLPDDSSDDEELNQAIIASMESQIAEKVPVQEILLELSSKISTKQQCKFNINRSAVWEGAMRGFQRVSYDPNLMICVKFSDDMGRNEEGVDLGGPRREFLRLLMETIARSPMFEGKENSKNLALDSTALREDRYYTAGRAIAVSLVHGGPPPNFLSPTVFSLLVDGSANPVLEDIADTELLEKVKKVSESTTLEDLEKSKAPLLDYLANAGCLRPMRSIRDRDLLVHDIVMFQVIHRVQGPFQRFCEGLKTLGVLEKIRRHPDSFRPLFCYEPSTLTADRVDDLFSIRLSPEGSNKRAAEEMVVTFWRDYLQDAEEEEGPSKLQKILAFATGASVVPPIGFSPTPSVQFIHKGDDDFSSTPMFPMANTCVNYIKLPLHVSYQLFKEKFDFALGNTYGFGRA
uniref:G2/M phase-specific E3 ubiquitin-protein ligase-like n=1 Tax=Centroberyx gerrardi TaxID=166262 RepID=UPI003AAF346D